MSTLSLPVSDAGQTHTLAFSHEEIGTLSKDGCVTLVVRMEPQPPEGWEPNPDYNDVAEVWTPDGDKYSLSHYEVFIDDGEGNQIGIPSPWWPNRVYAAAEQKPFIGIDGSVIDPNAWASRFSVACTSVRVEQQPDGWYWVGTFDGSGAAKEAACELKD